MPYGGGQTRDAVAGKGVTGTYTRPNLPGNARNFGRTKGSGTLGAWAAANGFADENGRLILHGLHGDFDVSDYEGIVDASSVKNLQAFQNLTTNEELSEAYSAMSARYPRREKTSLEEANTRADSIGPQAMQNVLIPEKERIKQAERIASRIRYLRTLTGRRDFLERSTGSA